MATLEETLNFISTTEQDLLFILSCVDQYFSCIHILLKQSFFSEFQVIPAAYIANKVKFSCLFEPTWHIFFHFLPWMHWVERKWNFSLVFVQSFRVEDQSFFSEFQVIPAAYIVNKVKFSCLFEPTWHIFFHFLPWMHWVERKWNFSLVFVQSFRSSIHVLISVRWVLNNATYVLQWQWTSCVCVTCKAWRNAHWPIARSVAILRGLTLVGVAHYANVVGMLVVNKTSLAILMNVDIPSSP